MCLNEENNRYYPSKCPTFDICLNTSSMRLFNADCQTRRSATVAHEYETDVIPVFKAGVVEYKFGIDIWT